jgi:hypothetical protein
MAKRFTLTEAQRLIPQMERLLRDAIERKAAYEDAEREIHTMQQRVMMMGGVSVDRDHVTALNQRREEAASQLRAAIEGVQEEGVQIKDLDVGLIDFPTLYRGAEVLLCWKLGERKIEYWHDTEEGFRGRKPIDQDFLDNHGH